MADFTYFDQYSDIEIDLTSYLKSIPVTGSAYTLSNLQPVKTTSKNLFTKYEVIIDYKHNIDLILQYQINEGETIDVVSYNIYGSVEYWWILAMFNDIKNIFTDWPLSQQQLITIAKNLYEKERKYSYNTYLDFLAASNDEKRDIIVPKKDTIKDIIWKYRQVVE
jgi:hypothetical protein